ncbi:MAG TPA: Flp family type IVb pilin [Acidimicrobiia bacterium]
MRTLNRALITVRVRMASQHGANLIEYGMLVGFIAVIVVLAVTVVGEEAMSNIDVGSQLRPP